MSSHGTETSPNTEVRSRRRPSTNKDKWWQCPSPDSDNDDDAGSGGGNTDDEAMLMNSIYSKLFWQQEEDFAMRNDSARSHLHQLQRARAAKARERQRLRKVMTFDLNAGRSATQQDAAPERLLVPPGSSMQHAQAPPGSSIQHALPMTGRLDQDDTSGRWLIPVQSPPPPLAVFCALAGSQDPHQPPPSSEPPGVEAARWADRREQIRRQQRTSSASQVEHEPQQWIFRLLLRLKRQALALLPELRA